MSIPHIIMLLIGSYIAIKIAIFVRRQMQMNALRRRPPKRVCFQIKLPSDSTKSNQKMTHAWERIWSILPNSDRMLPRNENVIRMALVGQGAIEGSAPHVRFLVWCPPSLADKVELELVECYHGDAEVVELKPEDDPFLSYLGSLHSHREFERELAAYTQRQAQPAGEGDQQPQLPRGGGSLLGKRPNVGGLRDRLTARHVHDHPEQLEQPSHPDQPSLESNPPAELEPAPQDRRRPRGLF